MFAVIWLSRPKSCLPSHDVQIHRKFPLVFPPEGWALEWGEAEWFADHRSSICEFILKPQTDEACDDRTGAHIY